MGSVGQLLVERVCEGAGRSRNYPFTEILAQFSFLFLTRVELPPDAK